MSNVLWQSQIFLKLDGDENCSLLHCATCGAQLCGTRVVPPRLCPALPCPGLFQPSSSGARPQAHQLAQLLPQELLVPGRGVCLN